MDSRTRFEGGLSVKEKKEFRLMGSWIPATPENPIPVRRHFIPVESHGHFIPVESHGHQLGHANWQEMARLPSRYVQEVAKFNGHTTAQQFGRVDNMMVHQFGKSGHTTGIVNHFNGNGIVDHSNGNGNAGSAERTRMRAYSNYHSFTHILGTNTSHAASLNNTHESIPNMANSPNLYRTSQVSQYGLPIPQRPRFDLNIPPTMENTATSCVATSVQHTAAAINGAKLEKGKLSATANLSRGKCSTEGEGAQSHLLLPIEHEVHQHHFDGHLNTIVNSSSAVGPRPTKEPKVLEIGESGGGIDLNKMPAQKPPKQRKHRPKVVAEGKLKGATKAAITKAATSEEKPTGKRKYVHRAVKESETDHADKPNGKRKYKRKKIQESATQQTDFVKGTTNFNAEIAGNSCIRALNVDIESNKGETQGRVKLLNNKEMDFSLNADFIGTESIFGANKMHRTNSTLHISKLNRLLAGIQQSAVITNPIPSTNQTQSNCITMLEGQAAEHLISPLNSNPGGSLTVWRDDQCQFSKITDLICPETHKKRRADNGFQSRPYAMPSHAAPFEGSSPRTCVVGYTSQHKRDFESDAVNRRQNYEVSGTSYNHLMITMNTLSKSNISSEPYSCMQMTGKTSGLTQSHNLASLTTMKSNMHPPIPKASTTAGDRLQSRTDHMGVPRQKKTSRLAQSSSIPREKGNMVKEQKDPRKDCQQLSASSKVTDYVEQQAKKKVSSPIEEIINHLEGLHLDGRTNEVEEEQNALVLYKGCSKIVPCESKRHKPRPKVDLDMETERVWKLLMGKEGSEGFEDTDKEKQKWWEEERKVFHGRADSFITRMHLVQGDRCFSKWKGSVVDSVIGVFLTQNVSDHLSSSAFMSLAARFPLSPTSSSMCEKESTNIMVKQPDIGMQTQETIKWIEELLSSSQHDQSYLTLQESARDWRDYESLWIGTSSIAEAHSHNQEDEVLSSQGSSDSLIVHANGGVGSYPGSNSEAEDFPSGRETNKSHAASSTELQMCSTNLFEEFYCGASRGKLLHERARHGNEQPDVPVDKQQKPVEWDCLQEAQARNGRKERSKDTMDSLNYESLRSASISEISEAIKERGMNNMLAKRIKEFLDHLVRDHGSIDLEWLRDVPPEKAKDYLLSIKGLGLKSVECVRLLTLHHRAFPVDTNVGRIAVRLGWVPLQPLPESQQLHLLELYTVLESVQKYLWPRLCKLDQQTLYKLHYQLITFGKVFCTKKRPNCNACPMTAECRHFASAFASARLALPGPKEKSFTTSTIPLTTEKNPGMVINHLLLPPPEESSLKRAGICIPIVEEPPTPEQGQTEVTVSNIEDTFSQDPDEIPTISLNMEELSATVQNYVQDNMEVEEGDMSKALVVLTTNAVSIPMPKLKNASRLQTEHQVYQLPDSHPLLKGMDRREPDDPSPYLLAIWTPGETSDSIWLPEQRCESHEPDRLCNSKMCFSCNSIKEANSKTVRGTLLIPCRTAMRGSFPLNGTYFQVNEMFADHESSLNPIEVPRSWIWNLPRRMVYFGTSVSSIFKGLSTQEIQYCFWKGFVCVRGFEQKTRAPRPLVARLNFPASKLVKAKIEKN